MSRLKIGGSLYRMELRRLWSKRYVRILFALMLGLAVYLNVRNYAGETGVLYLDESEELVYETMSIYDRIQLERQFAAEYSGQIMDDALLNLTREKYRKVYEEFLSAHQLDCSVILLHEYLVTYTLGQTGLSIIGSRESLLEGMEEELTASWYGETESQELSGEEIRYWEEKQEKLTQPYIMAYTEGYGRVLDQCFAMNLLTILFVLVSLCGSLSDDEAYGIRPLLASARYGRRDLILIRLAAGETLAVGASLLLLGLTALIQFGVCGTDGFQAPLQFVSRYGADGLGRNLTAGEAVGIGFGICLLLSVMTGAVAAFLSILFGRAVPALALSMGFLMVTLVRDLGLNGNSLPQLYQLGVTSYSRIKSYLPFHRVSGRFFLDQRLIAIGSLQMDWIPACVILYGGLTAAALAGGILLYKRRCVGR